MAKATPDEVLDTFLEAIRAATTIVVCSDQPANFAGIAAVTLADEALSSDWGAIANGDSSGRKLTVPQVADVEIDSTGDADHIVLHDGASLLYVTTCTQQSLTQGGTVTIPSWDIEIADPS